MCIRDRIQVIYVVFTLITCNFRHTTDQKLKSKFWKKCRSSHGGPNYQEYYSKYEARVINNGTKWISVTSLKILNCLQKIWSHVFKKKLRILLSVMYSIRKNFKTTPTKQHHHLLVLNLFLNQLTKMFTIIYVENECFW